MLDNFTAGGAAHQPGGSPPDVPLLTGTLSLHWEGRRPVVRVHCPCACGRVHVNGWCFDEEATAEECLAAVRHKASPSGHDNGYLIRLAPTAENLRILRRARAALGMRE
jgi:hypothetical protein